MRIFINTLGSQGDVQPFVALGIGLQAAGHTVTVCTSASFRDFITGHGLNYGYMTDEFIRLIGTQEGREVIEGPKNIATWLKTHRDVIARVGPLQRQMINESWEAAQKAKPDLILFHVKALGAPHIAEKLGIPAALAVLQPLVVPTGEFANPTFPDWSLGHGYNRLTHQLMLKLSNMYARRYTKTWRTSVGLSPRPQVDSLLHLGDGTPLPVLHAYSEHVVPRPADWPETAHVTGYWFLPRQDDWQPDPALQAFLDAGSAPVYVGFGSMAGRDPQKITRIVVEALKVAGVRGIVASGWGGLSAEALPESIFKVEHVPHDWLFPRMAAVVHHGGAGTTAAGLRAGRPTIICPFFGDQPFWGKRVAALGVGSEPIPYKRLSAEKLAAAVRQVTTDSTIREKAAGLGEQIRAEDGIARTLSILEALGARAPEAAPAVGVP